MPSGSRRSSSSRPAGVVPGVPDCSLAGAGSSSGAPQPARPPLHQRATASEMAVASETASLDNHQEVLLDSLRLLVENVRVREKDRLNLLWDRERERKTEERSVLRRENERMKSQSKADRERSEYALSLVKAMKPLITQTLGGMVD